VCWPQHWHVELILQQSRVKKRAESASPSFSGWGSKKGKKLWTFVKILFVNNYLFKSLSKKKLNSLI
jgi:hypothetical protein